MHGHVGHGNAEPIEDRYRKLAIGNRLAYRPDDAAPGQSERVKRHAIANHEEIRNVQRHGRALDIDIAFVDSWNGQRSAETHVEGGGVAGREREIAAWSTVTEALVALTVGATAMLKLTAVDPVLVNCRGTVMGSEPEERNPNETLEGTMLTLACSAARTSNMPAPAPVTLAGEPVNGSITVWAAVFIRADLICSGVSAGLCCFTRAAAPVTMGVE